MDGYSILAENKEFSKLCTEGLAASEQLLGTGYAADLREARVGKCRCPCLLSDALKESKKDVYQVQGSGVASLKRPCAGWNRSSLEKREGGGGAPVSTCLKAPLSLQLRKIIRQHRGNFSEALITIC